LSYEDLNFKEDVIIYPNPVIDELNIEFSVNRTNYEVKIINYLGNEVYNVNHAYSNGRILINLSKLVTGIYYVCLGNTVHKIVKF
jgi:hypothetical protein